MYWGPAGATVAVAFMFRHLPVAVARLCAPATCFGSYWTCGRALYDRPGSIRSRARLSRQITPPKPLSVLQGVPPNGHAERIWKLREDRRLGQQPAARFVR